MSTDVVVVAGMHRSGTSLVARIINLLGIDLGAPASLMQAKPDNPTGFWESLPVSGFNDDLLAELGGRWDRPPMPPDGWEQQERLEPWRERARSIVENEFGDASLAGWKDPRMSLVLPFWRTVVNIVRVVVVVRDPGEVAGSLQVRDGTDSEDAAFLWLAYTVGALKHAPRAHVVRYGDFFDGFDAAVDELALALDRPSASGAARKEIEAFFDRGLRHHTAVSLSGPFGEAAAWVFAAMGSPLPDTMAETLWHGLRDARGGPWSRSALERRIGALEIDRDGLTSRIEDLHQSRASLERRIRDLDEERSTLADALQVAESRLGVQSESLAREERIGRLLRNRLESVSNDLADLRLSLAAEDDDGFGHDRAKSRRR